MFSKIDPTKGVVMLATLLQAIEPLAKYKPGLKEQIEPRLTSLWQKHQAMPSQRGHNFFSTLRNKVLMARRYFDGLSEAMKKKVVNGQMFNRKFQEFAGMISSMEQFYAQHQFTAAKNPKEKKVNQPNSPAPKRNPFPRRKDPFVKGDRAFSKGPSPFLANTAAEKSGSDQEPKGKKNNRFMNKLFDMLSTFFKAAKDPNADKQQTMQMLGTMIIGWIVEIFASIFKTFFKKDPERTAQIDNLAADATEVLGHYLQQPHNQPAETLEDPLASAPALTPQADLATANSHQPSTADIQPKLVVEPVDAEQEERKPLNSFLNNVGFH